MAMARMEKSAACKFVSEGSKRVDIGFEMAHLNGPLAHPTI